MTLLERLIATLPPFLRPRAPGITADYLGGVAAGNDLVRTDVRLLRAQGAARRFSGEFSSYYASDQRKDDVARIAAGRLLSKRSGESWADFEIRVRAFIGIEDWGSSKQRYTVTGDVAQWGCFPGIERELERTGLEVDSIVAGWSTDYPWKVYDFSHIGAVPTLERSKMYAIGETPPQGQRLTKLFTIGWLDWTFYATLSNPNSVDFDNDEIVAIVKLTKPAWTRCMLALPESEGWLEVI